ncbi:hypothetical protein [Microcystis phage Mel-JY34]
MQGGTKQQASETTTTTEPWKEQQPYLKSLFAEAEKQYKSSEPQFFQGQQTADQSAATLAGQQYVKGFADTSARQIAQGATGAFNSAINAPDLSANPYFDAAAEAAIRPVVRQFNESVLPGIRQTAIASGGYGDSRMGVAEGIASDRLQQNVLDTTSRMALDAYGKGLDTQTRALALAPTAMQTGLQPGVMMDTVGQSEQAYQQQLINDAINKWNFEQTLPANKLATLQSLITGNYGGTTTGQALQDVSRTNPLMSGLGGAAAGASIGTALGGPGIGTGVGALIGILGAR